MSSQKSMFDGFSQDREEALRQLLGFANAYYQGQWEAQWEEGGMVYEFGKDMWRQGYDTGVRLAMEVLGDELERGGQLGLPDPAEVGLATFIEAHEEYRRRSLYTQKKAAEHFGYSHDHFRHTKSKLDKARKID